MFYPDIDDLGLDTLKNGVCALSQYDRAFLLSVVNSSRFWGTLTNEQQGYIEELENRLMADDITTLLEEIRDAIALGGGSGVAPVPVVSFNPVVSLVEGGCGCPEDLDTDVLRPSPCVGGIGYPPRQWDGAGFFVIRTEDDNLTINGILDVGDYELSVSIGSTGELRELRVYADWVGGGFAQDNLIYEAGLSRKWSQVFNVSQRGYFSARVETMPSFGDGDTPVKMVVCKRKAPQGGRHEIEMEAKPKTTSPTGVIRGFPVVGSGAQISAKPRDTEFTTTNTFTDDMVVYSAKFVFFLEIFPDVNSILKNVIRSAIALIFPALGIAAFADSIQLTIFGEEVDVIGADFEPEGDGVLVTIEFDLPVEGIPALVTNPLEFFDMADVEIELVTTSENETFTEFLLVYGSKLFVKWSKLVIDTGAIAP